MPTKVLVFESDAAFSGELATELGRLGLATRVVEDGNAGLGAAAEEKPDLILLSIELPRMNGFSVCNKLKKDPALKDVPLIIMSSESTDETFEQHRKLRTRADDYVRKPIPFADLLEHIRRLIPLDGSGPREPAMSMPEDSMIVIDDDMLLDEAEGEGAEDAVRLEPAEEEHEGAVMNGGQGASAEAEEGAVGPDGQRIDAEVEAFAEKAFDRLLDESPAPPAAVQSEAPTSPGVASASATATATLNHRSPSRLPGLSGSVRPASGRASDSPLPGLGGLPGLRSSVPPSTPGAATIPSVPPSRGGASDATLADGAPVREHDRLERERLERELAQSREQAHELEERLRARDEAASRAQEQVEQLQRELDAARRAQAPPAKSGASSREFLDLREALNRKDKELLALRDQISRKEKELLDASDSALALEREKADLGDKIAELEKELATSRVAVEALRADKEQAAKRAEDFQKRIEKTRAELDAKVAEFAELRQKQSDELALRLREIAELRSEFQNAREREAEERRAALAAARREAEDERLAAVNAREAEVRKELDATYNAREAELKEHFERRLATMRGEWESRMAVERERLEARIAELSSDLAQNRDALSREQERAHQVAARWEASRSSLELAKDALAAALAHIEEVEARGGG